MKTSHDYTQIPEKEFGKIATCDPHEVWKIATSDPTKLDSDFIIQA